MSDSPEPLRGNDAQGSRRLNNMANRKLHFSVAINEFLDYPLGADGKEFIQRNSFMKYAIIVAALSATAAVGTAQAVTVSGDTQAVQASRTEVQKAEYGYGYGYGYRRRYYHSRRRSYYGY